MTALALWLNPDKYAQEVPVELIVADKKVFKEGVERYKKLIKKGGNVGTIIVVRHPRKEIYAVLDGHHRFWAAKELGMKRIKCAVIVDYYGLTFHLIKKGFYQPSPEFTKRLRVPVLRWGEGMLKYLEQFKEDPLSMFGERTSARGEKKGKKEDLEEDDLI
jgi:hypothetical protein